MNLITRSTGSHLTIVTKGLYKGKLAAMRREISALVASGASALFVGLVVSALQVAGVISMEVAHLLIVAAWFVAVAAVCTSEKLLAKSLKHTILAGLLTAVVMGVALFVLDAWMVKKRAEQDAALQPQKPSTDVTPQPTFQHTVSPKSPSPARGANKAASPTPSSTPSPTLGTSPTIVATDFHRMVSLKSGSAQRLSTVLAEGGYSGPMHFQELSVCNSAYGTNYIYIGGSDVNGTNGEPLRPGGCHTKRAGPQEDIDGERIYLFTSSTGDIVISLKSK